ncbi:MAG: bifunctional folylpolyglutamate synthase/dihydrofolate synthase [Spirochaetota bacterium]
MSTQEAAVEELFAYFGSFVNFEQKRKQTIREYRLDRMRQLLEFFDNPQHKLKIIHIAGSKGKGSTAVYIASGLKALGFKTGLYSSPHISDYRERITEAGRFFDNKLYLDVGLRIKQSLPVFNRTVLRGDAEPTAFELFTLFAFLLFVEAGCSYAVIETGIGGRLDATNVVSPLASVITPIELEHTDILGNTFEQIAGEKAGIIKPGSPVFVSRQKDSVLAVIRARAEQVGSPLFYFTEYPAEFAGTVDPQGTHLFLRWRDSGEAAEEASLVALDLAMQGEVQAENAGLALTVLHELLPQSRDSAYFGDMLQAVAAASLPGRMEQCSSHPPIVLDGAHTPTSVRRTIATFQRIYGAEAVCIFGSVEGKDTAGMAAAVSDAFTDIIISRPGTFKPNWPEQVAEIFRSAAPQAELHIEAGQALRRALELSAGRPILVTGSFYMVAEIRPLLKNSPLSTLEEK